MRSWDEYNNKLPLPRERDYLTHFWYIGGQIVAKQVADGAIEYLIDGYGLSDLQRLTQEESLDQNAYGNARLEYSAEDARVHQLLYDALFGDLDIADNPKRDKPFSIARDREHSSGFSDVYNFALDMVGLTEE